MKGEIRSIADRTLKLGYYYTFQVVDYLLKLFGFLFLGDFTFCGLATACPDMLPETFCLLSGTIQNTRLVWLLRSGSSLGTEPDCHTGDALCDTSDTLHHKWHNTLVMCTVHRYSEIVFAFQKKMFKNWYGWN